MTLSFSAKQSEVTDLKRERDDLRQTWDAEFTKLKGQVAGLRAEVRTRDENLDSKEREIAAFSLGEYAFTRRTGT